MRPRLILLLTLIVLLPLVLLARVGIYLAREQRSIREHQMREFLTGLLIERESRVAGMLTARARTLDHLAATLEPTPEALRQFVRDEPLVRQAFLLDAEGKLTFPLPQLEPTRSESAFLERTQPVWRRGELAQQVTAGNDPGFGKLPLTLNNIASRQSSSQLAPAGAASTTATLYAYWPPQTQFRAAAESQSAVPHAGPRAEPPSGKAATPQAEPSNVFITPSHGPLPPIAPEDEAQAPTSRSGWYSWYWDNGSHFIYWYRLTRGEVIGFELDRTRLLADIITALPETVIVVQPAYSTSPTATIRGRTRLRDANGEVLYDWGSYNPPETTAPTVSYALANPLQAWRLEEFAPPQLLTTGYADRGLLLMAALLGSSGLLIALAVSFYRESTREMREAAQRVNFVNQVSHELKTPLTNIRLYAELMETRLDGDSDPQLRRDLDIITGESQRLSRLINNVLTFARSNRRTLTLRPQATALDAIVERTVEHFAPGLARRGIRPDLQLAAPRRTQIDGEAVEQILGNLLSNVEKYGTPAFAAAHGARVQITTSEEAEQLSLVITDEGPGIPEGDRERIFLPFLRLSNKLTDGVAGTGIGLTIARELARLHGGDLVLIPVARGASFRLTLRPLIPEPEQAT